MPQKRETNGQSPYWTAKQAAAYFRISTDTLYRYCRKPPPENGMPRTILVTNAPPFRRTSRNVLRFPIEEFKAWCAQYDPPK